MWRIFPVVLLINRLPISQRLPVEKVYQRWNLLVLFSTVCGNIWSGTYQEVLSFRSLSGWLGARFCPTLAPPVFSFTKSKMTAQWTIASLRKSENSCSLIVSDCLSLRVPLCSWSKREVIFFSSFIFTLSFSVIPLPWLLSICLFKCDLKLIHIPKIFLKNLKGLVSFRASTLLIRPDLQGPWCFEPYSSLLCFSRVVSLKMLLSYQADRYKYGVTMI